MSDNKLLSENTVRRFMKLARVDTMSDNFISENFNEEEINEEEEVELEENIEDLEEQEEEDPMADEALADDPAAEEPMADMEPDAGEAEVGAADMSLTEEEARVLVALGERLAEALGAEEEADDMGDEDLAGEEPAGVEAELDGPEAPEEDEAAMGGDYARLGAMEESTQNEIVQEVLKRVTKRLVSKKLRK